MTKEKRLFTYDNRNSRDGDDIALISVLLQYAAGDGRKARMQAFERQYIAHRGFHDNRSECPENSLPAFERAIQMGYGIELDVQLTKDGVPVVFHDWDLKRAAGVDRKIRDCTFEELQSYRLFGSSQTIPAFEAVLELGGMDAHRLSSS